MVVWCCGVVGWCGSVVGCCGVVGWCGMVGSCFRVFDEHLMADSGGWTERGIV